MCDNINQLPSDAIRLDFRPDSPDYVSPKPIHAGIVPDMANDSFDELKNKEQRQKTVGLFKDEMPQTVVTHAYNYHLDYILLLGSETSVYVDNLKRTLVPDILPDVKIINQS